MDEFLPVVDQSQGTGLYVSVEALFDEHCYFPSSRISIADVDALEIAAGTGEI